MAKIKVKVYYRLTMARRLSWRITGYAQWICAKLPKSAVEIKARLDDLRLACIDVRTAVEALEVLFHTPGWRPPLDKP